MTFWIGIGAQMAKSQGFLAIPKKPLSTEGCSVFYEDHAHLQLLLNASLARVEAAERVMAEKLILKGGEAFDSSTLSSQLPTNSVDEPE
jgi:hypothetical protein